MSKILRSFTFLCLATAFAGAAQAQITLSAPPRETPEAGEKLYGPLAKYLSAVLDDTVVYRHPGDWRNYEKEVQAGAYDIVFDGPHFAAWRIDSGQAVPAVRLPGSLTFVLAVKADDQITDYRQLVGHKICAMPPPQLGTLSVYAMFPNPVQQPEFVLVTGWFDEALKGLDAGKCRAAVLRDLYFKKMQSKGRDDIKVIASSAPLLEQGFTVNTRLPAAKQAQIHKALMEPAALIAAKPILDRFAAKATNFVDSSEQDYAGLNLLRDTMIFGW